MEEIYKPNDPERIEVYHAENNDMLGDMPGWLISRVATRCTD